MKTFQQAADLIDRRKEDILQEWVSVVRSELEASASATEPVLRDHFLDILSEIQHILRDLDRDEIVAKENQAEEGYEDQHLVRSGHRHGKQRAAVTAYNAEQVYWEYVLLRRIIFRILHENNLADYRCFEAVGCLIENSTRESLAAFAGAMEKVQQKLFGTLVHDIRTPLAAIDMNAQLLSVGVDAKESKQIGDDLQLMTGRLNRMAYEILHTVTVEGGHGFHMIFETGNLTKTMDVLHRGIEAIYGDRFRVVVPEPLTDVAIAIDPSAIMRTLENLVSNAFKHGDPQGIVTLTITANDRELRFSVHNAGDPIDAEHHADMFEFLRSRSVHQHPDRRSWGMGLALAKATALGHHGTVEVHSSAEKGTEFTLVLPVGARQDGETATVLI